MVRKKVEGDEDQRRAAAREARAAGEEPSAASVTTGASKQPHHLTHRDSLTHEERLAERHRGKQGSDVIPGSAAGRGAQVSGAGRTFPERGRPDYDPAHERVFRALSEVEAAHGGEAVYLEEIAGAADLPLEETRLLLHDLVAVLKLVTELEGVDTPDLGPRFTIKPRL
jgi:hypothetical protein